MGNRIILVLGGARSGKSEFAEKLITKTAKGNIGYIATSQILDEEMKYRVILHQKRRPAEWKTYEIMHEAGDEIEAALAGADSILFDCVTMYVNNMLMDHLTHTSEETLGVSDLEMLQDNLKQDLGRMFSHIEAHREKTILFVSDELGMGIVPANAMSRVYRDLVGLANQYIANRASEVYLSVAGITIELKERGVKIQ